MRFTAIFAAAASGFALVPPSVVADYAMPPVTVVVKTVPLIIDATVSRFDPDTGAAHLEIHRTFRGELDAELPIIISKISLTCTPGRGLKGFVDLTGKRFVFLLASKDTLFEESTLYPVTEDPKDPGSLRIHFPAPAAAGKEPKGLTADEFTKLVRPG